LFVSVIPILILTRPQDDLYSILALSSIIAVAIGFLSGGLRVEVNDESVKVKWGGLRFRILRIPLDSIASIEVNSFRPMRDFGGWGIKGGWTKNWKGVAGFFMSGTRGVLIQTKKGKKYLLGSDTPDRLAAVIRSRMECRATV